MGSVRHLPAVFLLPLAACGQSGTDEGPGGVSVSEARALDEAAAMLEEQRLEPEDVASTADASPPSPSPSPKE